ncbi:MAG: hypothetical protein KAJ42_15980 [Gemmatimonadetes bacterium]|nr:hypothetical protein [Gemmatimonadota bacterium]
MRSAHRALSSAIWSTFVLLLAMAFAPAAPGGQQLLLAQSIPSPERHFGHVMGADRQLVGWADMVEYLRMVGDRSPRVLVEETGRSTHDRPFLLVQVSAAETVADLDRYKELQRRLYFQDHLPGQDPNEVHTAAQREELLRDQKAVLLITCNIHATEIGASQMALELVHHLATDNSPTTRHILDNTILLLVPSLNPDGQAMVVDWYDKYVGTEFEGGGMPWLYHPYVGHDNNRDMYMYTQEETRLIGEILWKEWFPSAWLDEHQMGSSGARIFVMPATDPINVNVHPLIYRWNGIFGQAQGAALEAAGKVGIVYDQSYTNFWPGAMAWTGWWHNQVGMLTELASVRIATPTVQKMAKLGEVPEGAQQGRGRRSFTPGEPVAAPRDVQPRTNYPRPWLGGRWTLRDIVEYEYIISMAFLETAADTRHQFNRHIYEVNRSTIQAFLEGAPLGEPNDTVGGYGPLPSHIAAEHTLTGRVMPGAEGAAGTPYAVVFDPEAGDAITRAKLLNLMERAGVIVEQAGSSFEAGGTRYPSGTYVIRLAQVYGRYAKEMLESQVYPEVRLAPELPPRPPYDVTGWSLGMQMGVGVDFVDRPFDAALRVVDGVPLPEGGVSGSGSVFLISPEFNDAFTAVNRLWDEGASVRRVARLLTPGSGGASWAPGTWVLEGVPRDRMDAVARELGLEVTAVAGVPGLRLEDTPKPRIAIYQGWSSNMDEGWTRWVLDAFEFEYTVLHPQDIRAAAAAAGAGESGDFRIGSEYRAQWPPHVAELAPGRVEDRSLSDRFDVILFTHEGANSIVEGRSASTTPEVYHGGIGEAGVAALEDFVAKGGSVVTLGSSTDLAIRYWDLPVKNMSEGLSQDEFLVPGSVVNVLSEVQHPLAWGMAAETHGYFSRSPFFSVGASTPEMKLSVALRYPHQDIRASGWLRGEEHLAGRAAAVQADVGPNGGKLVLLGLRPQHRAQTHATFKLLFNALVGGR